jgi:hypothetical protein
MFLRLHCVMTTGKVDAKNNAENKLNVKMGQSGGTREICAPATPPPIRWRVGGCAVQFRAQWAQFAHLPPLLGQIAISDLGRGNICWVVEYSSCGKKEVGCTQPHFFFAYNSLPVFSRWRLRCGCASVFCRALIREAGQDLPPCRIIEMVGAR